MLEQVVPQINKPFGLEWLINPLCWNPSCFIQTSSITSNSLCFSSCLIVILKVLFYCLTPFIFKWFPYAILKLKPHKHQKPSLLIIENLKKQHYSPNDRFPIKFFIKIINLDSSHRVPPMSPCPPLIIIITRVPLINLRLKSYQIQWNSMKI